MNERRATRWLSLLVMAAGLGTVLLYRYGPDPGENADTLQALGFGVLFVGIMMFVMSFVNGGRS